MESFEQKYNNQIYGVLHGFDRMIIKGYIGLFYYGNNFYRFLNQEQVQLKDFKDFALRTNKMIKSHIDNIVENSGCYKEYLRSPNVSKEGIAKQIQKERNIEEGLICILSCTEPCTALTIDYNSTSKKLEK